ncbi:MAG: response regulator [Pseudobacteriovorax sp.]|nr:response regulator [Pseudobacteriovorax sp.]
MGRILVLDGDPNTLMFLRTLLEDNGYTVFSSNSYLKAKNLLKVEDVDLVILDYLLPEKTGDLVSLEFGDSYAYLFLSSADPMTLRKVDFIGPVVFKPINSQDLLNRVASLLSYKNKGFREGA